MDEPVDIEHHLENLADAIRVRAARVHAAEAEIVDLVAEFTADPRWNQGDWKSVSHWLSVNCGYTTGEALAIARVATKTTVMPTVMAHARAGEVSTGVAAIAAKVASPEIDTELALIVTTATPNQAARVLSKFRELRPTPPKPCDDDFFWNSHHDDNGDWRNTAKLPPEIGALVDAAYDTARRDAEREQSTDDELDDDLRRTRIPVAEIVRRMAAMILDVGHHRRLTRPGGEPFTVTVLIDLETLMTGHLRLDSTCRIDNGPDVTPELVRRLAEEGTLELLWHRDGVPLKLGRQFRLANRDQRRALRFRDKGCAVPGCSQKHYVHAHHVQFWENNGLTDLDNMVSLCSWHHSLVHHHGWTVIADGNQHFTFLDRHGQIVGNRLVTHLRQHCFRQDSRPPPGRLADQPEQQALPITGRTATCIGGGEKLTFYGADVWVSALLTRALEAEQAADDNEPVAA